MFNFNANTIIAETIGYLIVSVAIVILTFGIKRLLEY